MVRDYPELIIDQDDFDFITWLSNNLNYFCGFTLFYTLEDLKPHILVK